MKKHVIAMAVCALVAGCATAPAPAPDEARVNAAREAAKTLGGALQKELKAALDAGGPVNAIGVCNEKAPEIAKAISKQQNMDVGRTSLKLRNQGNVPDKWEKQVLEDFEKRKAAGEDPAKLERYEIVGKEFRYMKAIAIPADAPCLKCHGEKLDEKVQAKLKDLYPSDKATGFKTGDLRGAFTIRQAM
jgi:hypothetical protein